MMNSVRFLRCSFTAAVLFALIPAFVQAQTFTNLSSSGNWSVNTWVPSTPNAGGSSNYVLQFDAAGTTTNDLGNPFVLNSLGSAVGVSVVISGNNLTFMNNGTGDGAKVAGLVNVKARITGGTAGTVLKIGGTNTVTLSNSTNDFVNRIAGDMYSGLSFSYPAGTYNHAMADGFNTFGKLSAPNGINLTLTAGAGSTNYFGFQSTVILGGSAALGGLGGGGTTILSGGTWSNFNGNADGVLSGSGNTLIYTNAVVSFMCGNGAGGGYGSLTLGTGNRLIIRRDTVATFGTANGLHINGGSAVVENGGIITNSYISVAGSNSGSLIITNGGYAQVSSVRMGDALKSNFVYVGSPGGGACSVLNTAKIQPGGDDSAGGGIANYVIVDQGGILTNCQVLIGRGTTGGDGNYLVVTNGGQVFCSTVSAGTANGCSSNFVHVGGGRVGANSVLSIGGGILAVGNNSNAPNNYLSMAGGGLITNCGTLTISATNEMRCLFNNSGGGQAVCTSANLSGSLTVSLPGGMALLSSNSFDLIRAGSISGGFVQTNAGVIFNVSNSVSAVTASLNDGARASGTDLVYGRSLTLTATNAGWMALSTNRIPGSTFEVPLLIATNGATQTVSKLADYLNQSGLVATNKEFKGYNLFLTFNLPAVEPAYICWDFTGFDSNLAVSAIRCGPAPDLGTVLIIK